VIGVGHQGNSVSHSKEVEEYLALMHKEIHPLWAHGYLLRLDTIYRKPGSRLDNSNLEAVLEITLNSVGTVTDVRVVKSSGISDYDSAAIDVAWHSSPQIAPPHVMISKNGKSYVHWTFWRDGRQCGVFGVKVFKLDGTSRDALNFSLKAVNQQERKLGLTPSVMNIPGTKNQPNPQPDPSESQNAQTLGSAARHPRGHKVLGLSFDAVGKAARETPPSPSQAPATPPLAGEASAPLRWGREADGR
jgi:TonB family protein